MHIQEFESDKILPFNLKQKKALKAKQDEFYREYSQEFKELRKKQTARLNELLIDYEDEGSSELFDEILAMVKGDTLMVSLNCRHDEKNGVVELEPMLAANGNWYLAVYSDRDHCKQSDALEGFDQMHEAEVKDVVAIFKENTSLKGICINPYVAEYCIIDRQYL